VQSGHHIGHPQYRVIRQHDSVVIGGDAGNGRHRATAFTLDIGAGREVAKGLDIMASVIHHHGLWQWQGLSGTVYTSPKHPRSISAQWRSEQRQHLMPRT